MTDGLGAWLLAVFGGGAVGALYFGGLWWTVRRIARTRHPGLLMAASYLVRTTIAAVALLAVASGEAGKVLAALAGFLVVRVALVRSVRGGGLHVATAGTHAGEHR